MTDKQLKAVPLYERLEKIPADIRFGVKDGDDWRAGTVWYPIGAMCQQAAAELRRLHEVNAELVEAVKAALSDDQPYIEKCKAALSKAEGK
jgi:hypothetical protein